MAEVVVVSDDSSHSARDGVAPVETQPRTLPRYKREVRRIANGADPRTDSEAEGESEREREREGERGRAGGDAMSKPTLTKNIRVSANRTPLQGRGPIKPRQVGRP